jgi:hypothetical protein
LRAGDGAGAWLCLRADPTEKLEMLDALAPLGLKPGKFRPPDKLIAMLATRQCIVMWSRWMVKSLTTRSSASPAPHNHRHRIVPKIDGLCRDHDPWH